MKIKKLIPRIVIIHCLIGLIGIYDLAYDKVNNYYHNIRPQDCNMYQQSTPQQIIDRFINTSNYTKRKAVEFLVDCNIKNAAPFALYSINYERDNHKNPLSWAYYSIIIYNPFYESIVYGYLARLLPTSEKYISSINFRNDAEKTNYWVKEVEDKLNFSMEKYKPKPFNVRHNI